MKIKKAGDIMKKLINFIKRLIFKNKYKKEEISKLKPGDLFWGKLKKYKGSAIPKGHHIRSFMFIKLDKEYIHCLFVTSKKNNTHFICLNCKGKNLYVRNDEIILLKYKEFKNPSNYYIDDNTLDLVIEGLLDKYQFSKYKDLFLKYSKLFTKGTVVSTLGEKLVVLGNKQDTFLCCNIFKQSADDRYMLSKSKYFDCIIHEKNKNEIIKVYKGLNINEIKMLEVYLSIYKKRLNKTPKRLTNAIGDNIEISDEQYIIIDIEKDYYYIASINHSYYYKIKATSFAAKTKSSRNLVDLVSNNVGYYRNSLYNKCLELKRYKSVGKDKIRWVEE